MFQPNNMNQYESNLFRRICNFQVDTNPSPFPFSSKLAWEYRWSKHYTFRVIDEYKKFVFLAMVADHRVSPPSHVDRVWHQHLLYTHSYWDDWCGKILEQNLHHQPSLGGAEEGEKYMNYYTLTLKTYRCYFGNPPPDIWHPPRVRSEPIQYQWVNRQHFFLIPNVWNWFTIFATHVAALALKSFVGKQNAWVKMNR